jgi:2-dehydropantoate 2-reductase
MKVAILGAGAVGSMMGGLLKHHEPDLDVRLFARGAHGQAMRRQGGVQLLGPWGTRQVALPVADRLQELGGSDFVILAVKSQATEETMGSASRYLAGVTVISLQNGINQHVLAEMIPTERLVMGMTTTIIAINKPGSVVLVRGGPTFLGPSVSQGPMRSTEEALALLKRTGLPMILQPDILGAQYNKLVFNSLGTASSLSASDFLVGAVLHRPWRDAVGLPLYRESLHVLHEAGIRLRRISSGADVYRFGRLLRILNRPVIGPLTDMVARKIAGQRPFHFSVHRDLDQGKPTEVDYINGELVRLAREFGMRAPRNEKVVELVHTIEKRGKTFSREEIIATFQKMQVGS